MATEDNVAESTAFSPAFNPWGDEGGVQVKSAPPTFVTEKPLEEQSNKQVANQTQNEQEVAKALEEAQADAQTGTSTQADAEETSKASTEVELPTGTGEEYRKFTSNESLGDVVRRGTQVPSRLLDEGELFKSPALLVDLKSCTTVYQISLFGLATFLYNPEQTTDGKPSKQDIPENKRAYVYIRNSQDQLYEVSYGDRSLLYEELPEYVKRAFGEEAEVKEVIPKPDGMGFKLKKCTNSLKSVHFDLNYWF